MSINIIPINGRNPNFDYENFEITLKNTIQKKCSEAKVFLFNNFPVSLSIETNIDLIMVIAIEKKLGNFYSPKSIGSDLIYFNNQIIPIKFVNHLSDDKITIENGQIIANENCIDYSSDINSMKKSLVNYLSNKCGLKKEELYIQPLVFIQNNNDFILDNVLISKSFDFKSIHKYFSNNNAVIFTAYKDWISEFGYSLITTDMERITDQASKDSEIGYLTKKKVERLGKQMSSSKSIFEELNKSLIIISGKAGTGKSSELLLLSMKCISNGNNTLYLSYNKILVMDISKTIKSFRNAKNFAKDDPLKKIGDGSVLTLHASFFRLSRSLGVLHILSAERIKELLLKLKARMRLVYDFIFEIFNTDFESIKTGVQNHTQFDIGTKEVGIDFVNFIQRKRISSTDELKKHGAEFFKQKKKNVEDIEVNNVFLADYYGVLESTLLQIQNPKEFYTKYSVEDKHELLDVKHGLNGKYVEIKNGVKTVTEKGFIEFKNRRVGGYRNKRTLFIDEGQDCHRLEKDILISIYGSENIVVASGGKEQLIRHVELCNWEVSQTKKIIVRKHYTKNKSYRVKKTVLDFCNFVALKYQIDLNLEPLDSEDEGELIYDFRKVHSDDEVVELFNHLNMKGKVNGCTAYESLLVLLESNSSRKGHTDSNTQSTQKARINEYGNIEGATKIKRGTWKHLELLANNQFMFWDGTIEDKSELFVPSPSESRVIYYESCRGLEAWSVACFSLDKFFNQKKADPDAEKYLIEDLFLSQNNEQRKSMYAATWILMAITRVIDTLYIQIDDRNSEFGRVVDEYLKLNRPNVIQM